MEKRFENLKEALQHANRYIDVVEAVRRLINDNSVNYPVSFFRDDKGNIKFSLDGQIVRDEAADFLRILEDKSPTLLMLSAAGLFNFSKYADDHYKTLLHNYGVHISHHNYEDSEVMMNNIRIWMIIQNMFACALIAEQEDEEDRTFSIPYGWHHQPCDEV